MVNSSCIYFFLWPRVSNRLKGKDLGDIVYCGQEYTVDYYLTINHGWENNKREIVETADDVLQY